MSVTVKTTDGEIDSHRKADSVQLSGEDEITVIDEPARLEVKQGDETLRTYLIEKVVWYEE